MFSIPAVVFQGFCLAAGKQTHGFGSIETWYLGNEHVKSLSQLLQDCKVERLTITLTEDVKPETMRGLFDALSQVNINSEIRISLYCGMTYRETIAPRIAFAAFKTCKEHLADRWNNWKLRVIGTVQA